MAAELRAIGRLLAERIGLDPSAPGSHLILRGIRQRMSELGLDDLAAYEWRVRQSEQEFQALVEEVVVAESWFFRDERPWQWLGEHVRTRWLAHPGRPPLRALSLACAGGEEPYSIAITLWDLGLPARRFQIDAVDVSARRLAAARRGVYSANAFRGADLGGRARYFRPHSQGYELDPAIRATVRFLQASVLDPRLLEGSCPYDVLFCRNLLIYLDAPARARVMAAIDRLLAPDGKLFIGHADRLDATGAEPKFKPAGDAGSFAYRRVAGGAVPAQDELRPLRPLLDLIPSIGEPAGATAAQGSPGASAAASRSGDRRDAAFAPPHASAAPSLLDQASQLANQGRFAEAIAMCQRCLQLKGHSTAGYFLMGMICQAAGDRRRAEDCFQKAVYLDPRHDEALLALALLAESRGDRTAAAGFRRRAERTVAAGRKQEAELR
jgi:chemotaxis protein methyltransferase WspC